ncbi:hypothetical protein [Microcoleus sp. herbarium14]|uniref:hypothetical protein n=1 Tax=Microcoleus sp. herbarium14 TaxID=3055439 RepID=UPI002FD2AEBF
MVRYQQPPEFFAVKNWYYQGSLDAECTQVFSVAGVDRAKAHFVGQQFAGNRVAVGTLA